jgi:hypothetical protein
MTSGLIARADSSSLMSRSATELLLLGDAALGDRARHFPRFIAVPAPSSNSIAG